MAADSLLVNLAPQAVADTEVYWSMKEEKEYNIDFMVVDRDPLKLGLQRSTCIWHFPLIPPPRALTYALVLT